VDRAWRGGAEEGTGGAWQVEVDDRVARSPGCPFGGDAGAEEGNGRRSQADSQMQHAGIAADQQGAALQNGGCFDKGCSPRQIESTLPNNDLPRRAIRRPPPNNCGLCATASPSKNRLRTQFGESDTEVDLRATQGVTLLRIQYAPFFRNTAGIVRNKIMKSSQSDQFRT